MTIVEFLQEIKLFCEEAVKGMKLPIAVQQGDREIIARQPDVYIMRLSDSSAAKKLAPYIIVQFVTSKHNREENERPDPIYTITVRFIFCVYNKNEQEGSIMLLNVMERVEHKLLEQIQIGKHIVLDEDGGLESLIYPDDTAPYYAGEMVGTFHLIPIKREVDFFGKDERKFDRHLYGERYQRNEEHNSEGG